MTKPADSSVTEIPAEWSDPREVMPHLAAEIGEWLTRLRSIKLDLAVIEGMLEPGRDKIDDLDRVLEGVVTITARLEEVEHDIASRASAFRLIAEALRRDC